MLQREHSFLEGFCRLLGCRQTIEAINKRILFDLCMQILEAVAI